MENSFPKHTIRKDFQNAIFIIKNGTMEDFKRWLAKYIKWDPDYITDTDVFTWLRDIYIDYSNDAEGEIKRIWDYIDLDGDVHTIGKALWNRLRDVQVMTHHVDGTYEYIHGFTEDGIGMIPFTPLDEPETIRKTIDNIIAHTGK